MWKKSKNNNLNLNSLSKITRSLLLLFLTLGGSLLTTNLFAPALAQSNTESNGLELLPRVANKNKVRIDGSIKLLMINQKLKNSFQELFPHTQVEIGTSGNEAAIKSLLDGQIDVAAIARGLTPAEKAQGLEQVRLTREKIAVVVGVDNPFQGGLTIGEFTRIFRGKITNWSQVGGPPMAIRFIDRSVTSETRRSLGGYPVFNFPELTSNSDKYLTVSRDKTTEIIQQLGKDGISYAIVSQVKTVPQVRILKIQGTYPDHSKYPFSLPLVYAYKRNSDPTVVNFVDLATTQVGKKAISKAKEEEMSAVATLPNTAQNSTLGSESLVPIYSQNALLSTSVSPDASTSRNNGNYFGYASRLFSGVVGNRKLLGLLIGLCFLVIFLTFLLWLLMGRKSRRKKNLVAGGINELETSYPNTEEVIGNDSDVFDQAVGLDFGELVWDIEAPVSVINTLDSPESPILTPSAPVVENHIPPNTSQIGTGSSITFVPRSAKWAYVHWYISESDRQLAKQRGGNILAIRLYDVTNLDLSVQSPPLVKEYECEESGSDYYLAIPRTHHEYMTEIGYLTDDHQWLNMARSQTIWTYNLPDKEL
ncbi:phosphate starvation-inducible protein PhoH [Cylindrospermopsis raciborskii S07]|uniref:Phosphate starvation-inducible protein PhoH n=5 Tax=Cylindrospermopsis raciborskii TaxID=77022 RepID=A0A853MCN0_9CYAN|nr:putative phosphate transport system substrate- binding protein [Cylindrospermopsis raciborskii CS-505]PNJ90966.1 phosphate starvation-inducible protein PhoH [Cylindrospermopsis raciborskii C03]PNJ94259.1 phosphate starvation-inducible protein PhoH [Cylindrospermopsis raciborskii C04]PNK00341.1 phosphate starvation-inducible protein PhoH [Cylindrospermopsis raciborskii S10]PNK00804.1 phosphate starvation-inducible protein PhoH [Cylindrospermopsis raciborskii C07]PNK06575.1 phosphate starvati